MNDHALKSLLSDKFKIGGDVTVAAGPVGRQASANTDVKTRCGDPELFAQQRSFCRGQLRWRCRAGRQERRQSHVRPKVTHEEILKGRVPVPESARSLLEELRMYSAHRETASR